MTDTGRSRPATAGRTHRHRKLAVTLRWLRWQARGRIRYDQTVLLGMALVTGVVVAYAAIGFYLFIGEVQLIAFGTREERLISGAVELVWWHVLLAPVLGGVVVSVILRFLLPQHRAHGVAEVIEANALRDGRIDTRTGLASALATGLSLGAGASTGREGPVVHLGATLASWLARRLHLSPAMGRTLLGCGVASAVAASFNAPIAGVFFALEVVVGHYALHAFAPIVVAAVAGTIISRIHLGDFPAFIVPDYEIVSVWEFPAFFLLGVVAAITAVAFMNAIMGVEDARKRWIALPEWALPPLGGLVVGAIAIVFPHVLGVGYEATDNALKEAYGLSLLVALVVAKIIATAVSLGCRFGGGVFSPSLFIGAMTGGAFGLIAAAAFPDHASGHGVYAVIGMGAVASAVLGAPISTILIVFELTGDYSVTVAVMIACAVASLITGWLHKPSFFHHQLERRGLRLEGGKASHLLKATGVKQVMSQTFVAVEQTETLARVRQLLLAQGGGKLAVTDADGALVGVASLSELPEDAFDPQASVAHQIGPFCRRNPLVLKADDCLETGLQLLERSGEECLPVTQDKTSLRVIGMLHYREALQAYNRALLDSQGTAQAGPVR